MDWLSKSECLKILRPMVRAYDKRENVQLTARKLGTSLASSSDSIQLTSVISAGVRLKNGMDCYFFFMRVDEQDEALGSCIKKSKTTGRYTVVTISESTTKGTLSQVVKTLRGK